MKCPEEVAQQLAVEAGSDVFLLKRIRYVDEEAVSIEESWVPAHLIHDVDAIDFFMTTSAASTFTHNVRVPALVPGCRMPSFSHIFS